MRAAVAALLLCLTAGCGDPRPPPVDRIEIRVSGWSAVDIAVDRGGKGSFRLSEPSPSGRAGSFSVTPLRFQRLRERLERYRNQAVPMTDESARKFIEKECPQDVPFVTDAGGVYIRWIGPDLDQHFMADLGCDRERQESRNKELLDIVKSLPVPLRW
ncbi:MAG TPA: hypothetical protein VE891_02745 [Allosphingosinicella sp.]|nr:hypothetical protein [Allosphingosinicella sp.]